MDFALEIDNTTGLAAMTFDKADTIQNNVWLSLTVRRGSFFANQDFGSRLHLLKRAKLTAATARLAEDYCWEALQWMLDSGKAAAVSVAAERDRTQNINRLKLLVEVTPASGDPVKFSAFVTVA
ncbi:MAG: Phage protein GP46 [Syntrophaceae bacterium PtaB.Bin095]|nr:MAG: Phage protein GP46 [Syntrophaceae bacterium PtaB.Bin095]